MKRLSLQPVRIRIDDQTLLRSEVLGQRYVYDVMDELYSKIANVEKLPLVLERKFDKKEDWEVVVKDIIFLLRKVGALYRKSGLTPVGKTWFTLLEELNMLIPSKPLEILKEDIPGYFFKRCFLPNVERVDRLVIISPWIAPLDSRGLLFRQVCEKIREQNLRTLVITREPIETWHREALELLEKSGAEVYTNENIHAKVLVCKMKDRRKSLAIVGSANLTRAAQFDNVEVGVLIKGVTDRYYSLIEDLISSSYDLKKIKWKKRYYGKTT